MSAYLYEEHLWFAGKRGALVRGEVAPQVLWFVGMVAGVQDSQLSVGQHYFRKRNKKICTSLILSCSSVRMSSSSVL
jgi:hypothetical protein